jgi:hypothetical protein
MFERALSAAGAAFVSAIIVNPLDVAKVGTPSPSLSSSPPALGGCSARRVWWLTRFACVCVDADEVAGAGGGGSVPPPTPDGYARAGCGENPISFCVVWGCYLVVAGLVPEPGFDRGRSNPAGFSD